MEKIRITQPTLGLDFEFEPDAGVEVDNQYVFDIIKKKSISPEQPRKIKNLSGRHISQNTLMMNLMVTLLMRLRKGFLVLAGE